MTDFSQPFSVGGVPILSGMGGRGIVAFRKVYFVDGTFGNDSNTGLSVEEAFASVQSALDVVRDEDTIVVMRGSYDEALTTGQLIGTSAMVDGRGRYCTLVGASNGPWAYDSPQLYNVSGATATLRVRSPGWRISGFRIVGDTGSPICVRLEFDQAAGTASTDWAPGTTIDGCVFYGAVLACNGIDFQGAPPDVRILDNIFELFGAGQAAMTCSASPVANANRCSILRNQFIDCVGAIDMNLTQGSGFNASMIIGNVINDGHVNTLVTGIDLSGGNDNEVHDNYLSGEYTTDLGRYVAGSGDDWSANHSMDTGAAGTSVDASGRTVKIPQAG